MTNHAQTAVAKSAKNTAAAKDKLTFIPLLLTLIVFVGNFWVRGSIGFLIFSPVDLFACVIGMIGVGALLKQQKKRAASCLLPAVLIVLLMNAGAFSGLRTWISHRQFDMRYAHNKARYAKEVAQLQAAGITYKRWDWGYANENTYELVYDARDGAYPSAGSDSDPSSPAMRRDVDPNACTTDVYRLDAHFFLVDDYCPM